MTRHLDPDADTELAPVTPAPAARTLATGVGDTDPEVTGRSALPAAGDLIGRFVVLGPIGEGGMGVVLRAYDPELCREVAIKLVGSRAEAMRQRLLREAQAIAQLSHPNVVTVYDVGLRGDELFIAMELIEGRTLDVWLAEEEPPLAVLARVFAAAARALAAAHARGIIHRDFKPTNVLVDATGRARVLDFGIARTSTQTEPEERPSGSLSRGDAFVTEIGEIVGTPAFMSPEQAAGSAVDARSDQYSFCATLALAACKQLPERGKLAELRAPGWLQQLLQRGLADDPDRRFSSMTDIADALERDRSHRRLALAGVAAVVLVAGGVAAVRFASGGESGPSCDGAADRLAGVWDAAARAKLPMTFAAIGPKFVAVADSVGTALDAYRDAWIAAHRAACEATRVRGEQSEAHLDRRMLCLDRRHDELQALVAVLDKPTAETAARALDATAQLTPISQCASSATLLEASALPEDPAGRQAIREVERTLETGNALLRGARYEQAVSVLAPAVARARELEHARLVADALFSFAKASSSAGNYKDAEAALREALRFAADAHADLLLARLWTSLVNLVGTRLDRIDDGLKLRDVAETAVRRAGDPRELRSELTRSIAILLDNKGDHAGAEKLLVELVGVYAKDPSDPYDHAMALLGLANTELQRAKYREAVDHTRRAVELFEASIGPLHPTTASARKGLGHALIKTGDYAAAEREIRRGIAVVELDGRADVPDHAHMLVALGSALEGLGKSDEARVAWQRALAIFETKLGPNDKNVAQVLNNLSILARKRGDHATTLSLVQRAFAIDLAIHGPDHWIIGARRIGLGAAYSQNDDDDRALDEFKKARAIFEKALGPTHPHVATALENIATIAAKRGQLAEAAPLYEQAIAILKAAHGEKHPKVAFTQVSLTEVYRKQRRFAEAVAICEHVLALAPAPTEQADALTCIATTHLEANRASEALAAAERALQLHDKAESGASDRASTQFVLAQALVRTNGDRARAIALARASVAAIPDPDVTAWLAANAR